MTAIASPRSLLLLLLAGSGILSCLANPLAIYPQRRYIEMVAEDVQILVEPEKSAVNGEYTFRMEADHRPEDVDNHVLVFVPVLAPARAPKDNPNYDPTPMVECGGKQYAVVRRPPGDSDALPKGWLIENFEATIPFPLPETFTVRIRYAQLNLPKQIACYLPQRPPAEAGKAKITFHASEGYALRSPGFFAVSSRGVSSLGFTPEDDKLLRAQLVKQQ